MGSLTAGDQLDEWLSRTDQLIVAICPDCGGWTMFVSSSSASARDWVRQCYAAGDLIIPMRGEGMGPPCPRHMPYDGRVCEAPE
jgi:hypothetical protein